MLYALGEGVCCCAVLAMSDLFYRPMLDATDDSFVRWVYGM